MYIAGCPPIADVITATIMHYLSFGRLPAVDSGGCTTFETRFPRVFALGNATTVSQWENHCPRRESLPTPKRKSCRPISRTHGVAVESVAPSTGIANVLPKRVTVAPDVALATSIASRRRRSHFAIQAGGGAGPRFSSRRVGCPTGSDRPASVPNARLFLVSCCRLIKPFPGNPKFQRRQITRSVSDWQLSCRTSESSFGSPGKACGGLLPLLANSRLCCLCCHLCRSGHGVP